EVQVMQDGVTPDTIEGPVGEGEIFAIGLDEIDAHAIGLGTGTGLVEITVGQVERRHPGAAPGQHHRRHAVTAAKIQHTPTAHNLDALTTHLRESARQGARLTIFPECALTGYCYESKAEAWPHAEPIPGPSTLALAAECERLGVWAVAGMLEASGPDLFNSCA